MFSADLKQLWSGHKGRKYQIQEKLPIKQNGRRAYCQEKSLPDKNLNGTPDTKDGHKWEFFFFWGGIRSRSFVTVVGSNGLWDSATRKIIFDGTLGLLFPWAHSFRLEFPARKRAHSLEKEIAKVPPPPSKKDLYLFLQSGSRKCSILTV